MTTGTTDRAIFDHLRTRREFCSALLDLSQRQRRLIADGDISGLLAVIGRKQRILGRLDALRQDQPPVLADWRRRRDELPASLRERCESLLQETEEILAELLGEEQTCTEQLTRRRDETRRQLSEISSGRQVLNAYGQPAAGAPHRILDVNQ